MKIVIKNGNIIKPGINSDTGDDTVSDIYIDNGLICGPFDADPSTRIIDAKNKYIIPGLVDLHVHFRDPGQTHKEDIMSGSMAAARGGFTTVCCMPNTSPTVDNTDTLKYVDSAGRQAGYVNVLTVSSMTEGLNGTRLCDFAAMNETGTLATSIIGHGICGISEDGKTLGDPSLMEEVCRSAKDLDLVIMDHAEPEIQTVFRDIEMAKKYGCRIHIQHISNAESVSLIRDAKADGLPVTCEATPHHFALDKSAIAIHGTNAKMNPPLAHSSDRTAVIEGLLDDVIDIIATDHAPHTEPEKNVSFKEAPNGIIGLETAFPVSYTILVKSGLMTLNNLIYKMSTCPLDIIGAKPGGLEPGSPADLAVIDIENEYRIDKNEFLSKGKNTPFHDMKVNGKILLTIHDGRITWEENK